MRYILVGVTRGQCAFPPAVAPKSIPPVHMQSGTVVTTRAAVDPVRWADLLLQARQALPKSPFNRKS